MGRKLSRCGYTAASIAILLSFAVAWHFQTLECFNLFNPDPNRQKCLIWKNAISSKADAIEKFWFQILSEKHWNHLCSAIDFPLPNFIHKPEISLVICIKQSIFEQLLFRDPKFESPKINWRRKFKIFQVVRTCLILLRASPYSYSTNW